MVDADGLGGHVEVNQEGSAGRDCRAGSVGQEAGDVLGAFQVNVVENINLGCRAEEFVDDGAVHVEGQCDGVHALCEAGLEVNDGVVGAAVEFGVIGHADNFAKNDVLDY